MKIAIVGAGIIGLTTAYELARDGHSVTVLERRGAAAEEASFANAGLVAPSYVAPWAAPGLRGRLLAQLLERHAPLRLALPLSLAELRWLGQFWRACEPGRHAANRAHMQRLARYSQQRLQTLSAALELEYDHTQGLLVLLRTDKDRRLAQGRVQALREAGLPFAELDENAARAVEPALNPDSHFAAALHLPGETVANCRQFGLQLKQAAQKLGVRFTFQQTVAAIDRAQPASLWLQDHSDAQTFDAVVLCAGADSARLLRPLGLKLPLVALWGHSVSAHVRESVNAPHSAVVDEHHKVAITRLGQRVRVAGGAVLGGGEAPSVLRPRSLKTLYKVLHDWFPGAGLMSSGVQEWQGAYPMLPDGPPLVGASGRPGLWLNLGHGASGWALACGSARLLADQIAQRPPEVDAQGLGVERLG